MPPRRTRTRFIVKCGSLLLLGAVLTVLAAWGPAVWWCCTRPQSRWRGFGLSPTDEEIRWWNETVLPGSHRALQSVYRAGDIPFGFNSEFLTSSEEDPQVLATRQRCGLPLRSLGSFRQAINDREGALLMDIRDGGRWETNIVFGSDSSPIILPVAPIWLGFAVDTSFFAALVWVALGGWRWVVRRRRLKRGLCPACMYPIGSSAVCSECGEALPAAVAPLS